MGGHPFHISVVILQLKTSGAPRCYQAKQWTMTEHGLGRNTNDGAMSGIYELGARSDEARNSRSCNGATSMEFMKLGMTQEHEDEDEEMCELVNLEEHRNC